MPRRNRNVATVRKLITPKQNRADASHAKSRKPSVKRLRFRTYGGEQ
jgi:hypothetical protein